MLKISILKVENPSCLWGRVIWCHEGDYETIEQHNMLLAEMNLFYHDVTQDLCKLKPKTVDAGQVCVVYWSVKKFWCRAIVESVSIDSVTCNVRCLLVDHGERLVVPSDQIRVALKKFLQLPFLVRRFHLARVQPITLQVSICEEKAELIPSSQWDSSATLYLHSLLQASTQTEAVLHESESESTSIELYLTVGNIKICVNDDLVAKDFAYYSRDSADNCRRDKKDKSPPLVLPSSILPQTLSTTWNMLTLRAKPPPVISQDPATVEKGIQINPATTQRELYELENPHENGSLKSPSEQRSPSNQSKNKLQSALKSDSPADTDSALAAALTRNLSLFRFLKFMNPTISYHQASSTVGQHEELNDCGPEEVHVTSNSCRGQEVIQPSGIQINGEHETQDEEVSLSVGVKHAAGSFLEDSQVEHLADEELGFSSSAESGSKEAEKTGRNKEKWACSRLLEWLNPEPLKPNPDTADDPVVPDDPWKSGILVHSALPVEPCTSLYDAPITDALRLVLRKREYSTLSPADQCSWPAVARGCNTIIISHTADQPLSYFAPLLTHILLNSVFNSLTSSTGPIAVLLCPGWEKAQIVYDLLEQYKVSQILHPFIMLLGVGKDEAKTVKIPKNCLLLVTTPFSLVRLLSCHCFMFLRLYHLVLDEANQLFSLAPDQMETILQHFQKVTSHEEKASCPQQIVAVAKQWISNMEGLLTDHMPYPCIVMTVPEEAALYGNVQQIILMTLESSKISVLLGALDFNPDVGQKTLIVANTAQEVEDVFKAVSNKSAFCLKTHELLAHQFDFVIQQWRKDIGPGTHVILVTTSDCLKCLGIRDANCVIHYDFPSSPKMFGSRLFCMAENFRNLSEQNQMESCHFTKSVLLISERNASHVIGLIRYLGRSNASLPSELLSFAQGIQVAREHQKTNRPLCSYLKSFGVCRDIRLCPDRHTFIFELDHSHLPGSGVIEVVPLYIKTASVFYGRIVSKDGGDFDCLVSEMACYYGDKKPPPKEMLVGGLYALEEANAFHRVKILSLPDRRDRLFYSLLVRFIDVGKEEEVKSHQILELPEQFQSVPDQAVEIIVCRVKPVDAEIDWHPKATRAISQKIRGLKHRARAVLSLGNTIFVDPMVRVTQVPSLTTVINEHNIQSEILKTGMGVSNPEHLNLLKALCQEGKPSSCIDTGHISGSGDGLVSLEFRIKAEEEVLAFRAAEISRLSVPSSPLSPNNHPLNPESPPPELHLSPVCAPKPKSNMQNSYTSDVKSVDQVKSKRDGPEVCSPASLTVSLKPSQNGKDQTMSHQVIMRTTGTNDDATKSFHPQIHWYQTLDSVIVTVKLMNPESQCCDFYTDRIIYRGRVNGRPYRAELDLLGSIAADYCSWEMKSNEPVLKLVKQKEGYWEKLVRTKNIFVSYDMEHFEEDEDGASCGQWFVEDTGENNWYVNSDSDSNSD